MGKALVIKDADFSQVKVEQIDLDGNVFLNEENMVTSRQGYFSASKGNWNNSSTTTTGFWPIKAGKYCCIEESDRSSSLNIWFVPTIDSTQADMTEAINISYNHAKAAVKAPTDGFICFMSSDNGVSKMPNNIYITSDASDFLAIEKESYNMWITGYITKDGRTGTGAMTLLYPVVKGEVIEITAESSYNCCLSCVKNFFGSRNDDGRFLSTSISSEKLVEIGSDDSPYRITIAANTTSQFVAPQNCYLAIFAVDGTKDLWPASINIISM